MKKWTRFSRRLKGRGKPGAETHHYLFFLLFLLFICIIKKWYTLICECSWLHFLFWRFLGRCPLHCKHNKKHYAARYAPETQFWIGTSCEMLRAQVIFKVGSLMVLLYILYIPLLVLSSALYWFDWGCDSAEQGSCGGDSCCLQIERHSKLDVLPPQNSFWYHRG